MEETNLTSVDSVGIMRIMQLIPHRYPMLLIDRVEQIRLNHSAVGIKAVSINEPFFQGHFPSHPIMPGVLIIEALAQSAAVLSILSMGTEAESKLVYFMTVDAAKFRKPVEPGMLLELAVIQNRSRANIRWFEGHARCNGQVMAEANFSAMIADRR